MRSRCVTFKHLLWHHMRPKRVLTSMTPTAFLMVCVGPAHCSHDCRQQPQTQQQHATQCIVSLLQDALLKEASLMANCTHPNLVRLCGVCLDPPLLVTEYYRNGRLSELLSRARDAVVARDTHGTNKVCMQQGG